MPDLLPVEFCELFASYKHTAFRLEMRESYASSNYGMSRFVGTG
jgi:hypothetical protein